MGQKGGAKLPGPSFSLSDSRALDGIRPADALDPLWQPRVSGRFRKQLRRMLEPPTSEQSNVPRPIVFTGSSTPEWRTRTVRLLREMLGLLQF